MFNFSSNNCEITAYNRLSFQTANPYKKFLKVFVGAKDRQKSPIKGQKKMAIALE